MALDVYFREDIQSVLNSASHNISTSFIDDVMLKLKNDEISHKQAMALIESYNQGRNNAIFAVAAAFNIVRPLLN